MTTAIKLKIQRLHPEAIIPQYQSAGAACFDLHACRPDTTPLMMRHPGTIAATFNTGLAFEIPFGWVMLIFSRSGHGFKSAARLANCVGVIDSDYRGPVAVRLTIDDGGALSVAHGDRIAQAMLVPIPQVDLVEVDELSTTARGAGGFGSTGTGN